VPEFKPRADLGMILNVGENARVWRVISGGSAESAGMMQGDILTFVDDHMVDSSNGLERILDLFSQGDTIKLKWKRGEKQMEAHVVLQ
jgi:S1-C subfamily serine protease